MYEHGAFIRLANGYYFFLKSLKDCTFVTRELQAIDLSGH